MLSGSLPAVVSLLCCDSSPLNSVHTHEKGSLWPVFLHQGTGHCDLPDPEPVAGVEHSELPCGGWCCRQTCDASLPRHFPLVLTKEAWVSAAMWGSTCVGAGRLLPSRAPGCGEKWRGGVVPGAVIVCTSPASWAGLGGCPWPMGFPALRLGGVLATQSPYPCQWE